MKQWQGLHRWQMPPVVRRVTLGLALCWLLLVAGLGAWISQRIVAGWLEGVRVSALYEARTTARVVDRLFTEMVSVANMVANQSLVIQLASRYRTDPPEAASWTRKQRATYFTRDPQVRKVGDFMQALAKDLSYGRIYMNNLSDDTVTASNWAEPDSIVGMIYTGRSYLMDALRTGHGHLFGIARLLRMPSYFVASRIEDEYGMPLGSVTVRFDVPEMALYLTGSHRALIVNRQGRVTTTSFEPFMLRNVSALLPAGSVLPPDGDEDVGEPLDIRPMVGAGAGDRWLIEGRPYLLRRQALADTQYQVLTLASLDPVAPMRRQHLWTAAAIALTGLALIVLAGHAAGQMAWRRQEERHAANVDALTGLPNRRAVLNELDRLFALAKRTQQWVLVAFIDLDDFKTINDTYGHEVGDQFLVEVGQRLSAGLRTGDMLGRLGGDEFVVIGLTAPRAPGAIDDSVDAVRRRLVPALVGTYVLGDSIFDYQGASVGVVSVDPATSSRQTVLKQADLRMYADKQARARARASAADVTA